MALKPLKQANWPAPEGDLERAEDFLRNTARAHGLVLVSGRDLDALSATALLERVLRAQETPVPEVVIEDAPWKRSRLLSRVREHAPRAVVCVGLRSPRSAVPAGVPALVLGESDLPPRRADVLVLGAEHSRRELPLSLLTWFVTARVVSLPALEWLALLGTLEEAGLNAPVPGYQDALKRHGKIPLTEAIATVRAASHAADFEPERVVQMLLSAAKPLDLALGRAEGVEALRAQRDHVQRALAGAARAAPHLGAGLALAMCRSADLLQPLLAARLSHLHPERVSLAVNTGLDRRLCLASLRSRCDVRAGALVERLQAVAGLSIYARHRRGLELSLPKSAVSQLLEAVGVEPEVLAHPAH